LQAWLEEEMMGKTIKMRILVCFILVFSFISCSGSDDSSTNSNSSDDTTIDPYEIEPSSIQTFSSVQGSDGVCTEDGKPVIRLYSTTWCPHCQWIGSTYDAVVKMYVDEGLIVAHHWEVNTGDDTLTDQVEEGVPDSEMAIFHDINPQGSIPTFVFGCKYYRIGNRYEQEGGLESEAAEFEAVIEALINEK
jgi:thiol-disulfide isomerase/thioredoxin